MVYPPATRLIKCDVQTDVFITAKWSDFVDGGNGCFYGIPFEARRVVEFKVEDKSIKEIGPIVGGECYEYKKAIQANNGTIYCLPFEAEYFLKIIPGKDQNAEVKLLEEQEIPRNGQDYDWMAGALANDGCIYFLPFDSGGPILKLDPNDGDRMSALI